MPPRVAARPRPSSQFSGDGESTAVLNDFVVCRCRSGCSGPRMGLGSLRQLLRVSSAAAWSALPPPSEEPDTSPPGRDRCREALGRGRNGGPPIGELAVPGRKGPGSRYCRRSRGSSRTAAAAITAAAKRSANGPSRSRRVPVRPCAITTIGARPPLPVSCPDWSWPAAGYSQAAQRSSPAPNSISSRSMLRPTRDVPANVRSALGSRYAACDATGDRADAEGSRGSDGAGDRAGACLRGADRPRAPSIGASLKRSRLRLQILEDIASVADGGRSLEQTLDAIAAILVPALGDFCMIDVIEEGQVRRAAVRVDGPGAEAVEKGLAERKPALQEQTRRAPPRSARQEPRFFERVTEADLRPVAETEEDLALPARDEDPLLRHRRAAGAGTADRGPLDRGQPLGPPLPPGRRRLRRASSPAAWRWRSTTPASSPTSSAASANGRRSPRPCSAGCCHRRCRTSRAGRWPRCTGRPEPRTRSAATSTTPSASPAAGWW